MEFEMQRLNPDMMARYEIPDRRPEKVNAVAFGMGEAMLGTALRLVDDAGIGVGVACVEAGEDGYAKRLNTQGGLYTVIIRGYRDEEPVRREKVVQCVLSAHEADAVDDLARNPEIAFGFVDDTDAARALAGRFEEVRRGAGLQDVVLFSLGADESRPRALADSLAFRSEADEAAKQCAEMNYLDDMLYLAEPYARLTLEAPAGFGERFPLDRAPGVAFADATAFDAARALKSTVFDGGLFLMAAAGWLNGCDTLADCMNHQRLRRFVGEGFTEEILPALSVIDKAAVEQCVIDSFERYVNPLNRNRVLRAADHLLTRFTRGPLQVMRHIAEADFEPPRRLAFALAATIMLYAGARRAPKTGLYEIARGKTMETIHDDPALLKVFSTLSHDMPPESLAYAALADRELWGGVDLRDIDGLEARVALDIAAMQREPSFLPDDKEV